MEEHYELCYGEERKKESLWEEEIKVIIPKSLSGEESDEYDDNHNPDPEKRLIKQDDIDQQDDWD